MSENHFQAKKISLRSLGGQVASRQLKNIYIMFVLTLVFRGLYLKHRFFKIVKRYWCATSAIFLLSLNRRVNLTSALKFTCTHTCFKGVCVFVWESTWIVAFDVLHNMKILWGDQSTSYMWLPPTHERILLVFGRGQRSSFGFNRTLKEKFLCL